MGTCLMPYNKSNMNAVSKYMKNNGLAVEKGIAKSRQAFIIVAVLKVLDENEIPRINEEPER